MEGVGCVLEAYVQLSFTEAPGCTSPGYPAKVKPMRPTDVDRDSASDQHSLSIASTMPH